MPKTINLPSGADIKVLIEDKPFPLVQALKIGASVDDLIMEAKIIFIPEPIEYNEYGEIIEREAIGLVKEIKTEGSEIIFNLLIAEGSPNNDYFHSWLNSPEVA